MKDMKFVALWLCIVCVFMFILQSIFPGLTDLLLLSKLNYLEFWRYLTAIFLHGSLGHLVYNLFALALFGFILEGIISWKKFIFVFLGAGVFANLIAVGFYDSSLGASGAIFGIIGTLAVLRPKMTVWAFSLPMPMFLASILWILGDMLGAVAFFSGSPLNNTGNLAHLSGVLFGIVYGFIIRSKFAEIKLPRYSVKLDEQGMREWEDRFMRKY
ncbi:MAG TPA: rhomboid family intramembrane serine protease [Candidatus Nanoarchaeia archaeon]|nr:rhomboid family intramembrane serine protease [Candidatus Nanoarchaeia archaeon]